MGGLCLRRWVGVLLLSFCSHDGWPNYDLIEILELRAVIGQDELVCLLGFGTCSLALR